MTSGAAWSSRAVCGHHVRLTSDGDQNAPVKEDEDQEDNDIEGQKVPDPVGHLSDATLPENDGVADPVHYIAGGNCHSCSNYGASDP